MTRAALRASWLLTCPQHFSAARTGTGFLSMSMRSAATHRCALGTAPLHVARRQISRVGTQLSDGMTQSTADEEVTVETTRVPAGVATITRRTPKPATFVNADGYCVREDVEGSTDLGATAYTDIHNDVDHIHGAQSDAPHVEFTVTEAANLEKLFRRPVSSYAYLSEAESTSLSQLLLDGCYKDELNGTNRDALLYQARLELTWIEEWADGLLNTPPSSSSSVEGATVPLVQSREDVRRLIKKSVLERVDLQKPLSYIIGSQPFFGCDILCRPPLLCPRPETEMWTHWLVSKHLSAVTRAASSSLPRSGGNDGADPSGAKPSLRVLDMCCGTGCIGVAIAKHVPSADVYAVDLLDAAIDVTRLNARRNGIADERFHTVHSDLFDFFLTSPEDGPRHVKPEYKHSFDVIVSNPPYVLPDQYVNLPRTITHWESKMALVGDDAREHKQYLYFQELCEYGFQLLKTPQQRHPALRAAPNFVVEVGLQAHLVASMMEKSGWFEKVELHLDYAHQERWVSATSV